MTKQEKLMNRVNALLNENGQSALVQAREYVFANKAPSENLQIALEYFISTWQDVAHPGLLAIACKAVGGKVKATIPVGAAYVLLAGGADVHDDIIDESKLKYSKPTVFGKFGRDAAILVGDALIFHGISKLYKAARTLTDTQAEEIFSLTNYAFFGISAAESKEILLREKSNQSPNSEDYLNMINVKAAVGEASMKIGAIIGNGTSEEVSAIGEFGKTLAVLLTVRDEFIDIFDLTELRHRISNECLPLPILNTLRDSKKSTELNSLISNKPVSKRQQDRILELVIESPENVQLKKDICLMKKEQIKKLSKFNYERENLELIMNSVDEEL